MYLFNNHEDGLSKKILLPMGGSSILVADKTLSLFESLTGEEQPDSIGSLLLILVLLLHIWGAQWLLQPAEPPITPAQPLMMEVSMVNAPHPQPIAAPPAPPKPPEPKKPPVKNIIKKKVPVVQKQVTLPKPMKMAEEALPAPSPVESVADTSKASSDAAPAKTASKAETYSEASFKANYGINPKPAYPPLARSRGWEGKVLLRVNVSADGHADSVVIYRSSDHEVLDESAVEAVEKWLFIPAKQGDKAVPCTVIVPINFTLNT